MARDTRNHILKKGIELVTLQGFNNTGISEILKSAAVPKGSFYYYFESKNEFGQQMVEMASEEFLEHLERFCRLEASPLERLRLYLEDKVLMMEETPCRCNCLFGKLSQEVSDDLAGVSESLIDVFEAWTERITELLKEAREQDELKADQPLPELARFILSGWEGAVQLSRVRQDTEALKEFIRILMDFLVKED